MFQELVLSENYITFDPVKTRTIKKQRNNSVATRDFHLVLSPLIRPLLFRYLWQFVSKSPLVGLYSFLCPHHFMAGAYSTCYPVLSFHHFNRQRGFPGLWFIQEETEYISDEDPDICMDLLMGSSIAKDWFALLMLRSVSLF